MRSCRRENREACEHCHGEMIGEVDRKQRKVLEKKRFSQERAKKAANENLPNMRRDG